MINVEIRYKSTETLVLGYSKLYFDSSLKEVLNTIDEFFTNNVDFIYVQDADSKEVIKLEKIEQKISKSFMLNILDMDKHFK